MSVLGLYFPNWQQGNQAYDTLCQLAQAKGIPGATYQNWASGMFISTLHPELHREFKTACQRAGFTFEEDDNIPPQNH